MRVSSVYILLCNCMSNTMLLVQSFDRCSLVSVWASSIACMASCAVDEQEERSSYARFPVLWNLFTRSVIAHQLGWHFDNIEAFDIPHYSSRIHYMKTQKYTDTP